MKIFQCIHKYADQIPSFEDRWHIDDSSTFDEILGALRKDGYASVYRLIPSSGLSGHSVFFTVWNYDRLQFAWARENGIETRNLDEIRLAQIESFAPDIVYDMSPFVSKDFASRLRERFDGKILAWNSFPKEEIPPADPAYDAFVSNYRPFVEHWQRQGKRALELQPGIGEDWLCEPFKPFADRHHDCIHYGQIGSAHRKRADLLQEVSAQSQRTGTGFRTFGTVWKEYRFRKLRRAFMKLGMIPPEFVKWPPRQLRKAVSPPLFGINLYETIRDSKSVLNTYIDNSIAFHSNMRIFETIGNGTLLLAKRGGEYPEGLEQGLDIEIFDSVDELMQKIRAIAHEPERSQEKAHAAQKRMAANFSKDRQYDTFVAFASRL